MSPHLPFWLPRKMFHFPREERSTSLDVLAFVEELASPNIFCSYQSNDAMIPPSLSPLVFTFCLILQCYCIPSFNMNLCRFEDFHLGHHTIWNILYKDRKLCKNKYSGKKGSVFLFNKPSFSHVV